jgi:hypothetical protein
MLGRGDLLVGKGTDQKKVAPREDDVWAQVFRRLVPWTVKRHGITPADAEEVVQEGIAQLIRSGKSIDFENLEAVLLAVGSRINGVAVNRRRNKALRAVLLTRDGSFDERGDGNEFEDVLIEDDIEHSPRTDC